MNINKIKNSITQTSVRHVWGYIYICVLMVCVSFYFTQGYLDIGEDKCRIFLHISEVAVPVWLLLVIGTIIKDRSWPQIMRRIGKKEYFVILFAIAAIIATLTSEYQKISLTGFEGWRMGLIVQLLMLGIYLIARDLFCNITEKAGKRFIYILLGIAGVVLLLGLLNRFSIFPIYMFGQAEDFISTLGNINWYCGYWCIWYGLACGLFLKADKVKEKKYLGIYVWFGTIAGVCIGSSSAYLVLAAAIFVSLIISLISTDELMKWAEMILIQALSFPTIRFIGIFRKHRMWYDSSWLKGICFGYNWIFPLMAGLILYMGTRIICRRYPGNYQRFASPIIGAVVGLFFAICILIVLNTCIDGGIWPLRGSSFFTWDMKWGNSRGAIWTITLQMILRMDPFRIFFGYGCDCYYYFVYYEADYAWKCFGLWVASI